MPRFKGLPMPESVVEMINQQGIDEGVPEGIVFGDQNNLQILDDLAELTTEDMNDDELLN